MHRNFIFETELILSLSVPPANNLKIANGLDPDHARQMNKTTIRSVLFLKECKK